MKQPVKESGVLRACLDLLAAERLFHRRWNTGAVKVGKRFFRFGRKGDPDILAVVSTPEKYYTPTPVWIETKRPGGKITPEQLAFADDVRARGHYHLFVDDASQVQEWLKEKRAR